MNENKSTPPDGSPALSGVASSQPKTAAELTLERVGTCLSVVCRDRCKEFAYHSTMDHFAMCICGHTQQAHSRSTS